MRAFILLSIVSVLFLLASARGTEPVSLEMSEVAPRWVNSHKGVFFADFGKDVYGTLEIQFAEPPPSAQLKVRLGEKLESEGKIDRDPPGSVNYREVELGVVPSQKVYRLSIPSKPFHLGKASIKMPATTGEVTPFRYIEIEGVDLPLDAIQLRQLFVHAPFTDEASEFESSDKTLNAVWNLCKHTMKATTAFGVYIDGERERIPYEADAYINLLSHYACDLDPRVARATFGHLLAHPTWPTEWSLHMPMLAAADYMATGNPVLAHENYETLKKMLTQQNPREDGLLVASAIVDWPACERDGYNDGVLDPLKSNQVGPMVNTVANAFYYRALGQMAVLARALNREEEAGEWERKGAQVQKRFNAIFFDSTQGIYRDGEGSTHCSLHANMFALAFGLAPKECFPKIADFLESRGMACSVYGAQYLLEALLVAGRDKAALWLMTEHTPRSWWYMIASGSTMTWEAWDVGFKKNLTWNHAWGAAPANIISRFVLGVRPTTPGYSKIWIEPQLGSLLWIKGRVPTLLGPVKVTVANGESFRVEVEVPPNASATVALPWRKQHQMELDGQSVHPIGADGVSTVEVCAGRHILESR